MKREMGIARCGLAYQLSFVHGEQYMTQAVIPVNVRIGTGVKAELFYGKRNHETITSEDHVQAY